MSTRATSPSPSASIALVPPGTALVRVLSQDDCDYAALLVDLDVRNARIGVLETEIDPLIRALEKFEWEYHARLGSLQAELRDLRATCDRIEHRTVRIHARMVADPNGVLGDLFSRDELVEIGEMFGIEIPASWFPPDDQPGRQRDGRRGHDWEFSGDANQSAEEEILRRLERRRHQRPKLAESVERELRTRYRSLARRFHPDLATSEHERVTRQEMMLRINAAWHSQDLHALRQIDRESAHLGSGWDRAGLSHQIAWARQECIRLDERIRQLLAKLRSLRGSDTFPLWFNPSLGNAVISHRATALRLDIDRERDRLEELKAAFRQALAAYAVATA